MRKVRAARVSVVSNTMLVILKLLAGVAMGSISVISEAIHSLFDLVAAIIANYSVRRSVEPPDFEHNYGHGKFEDVSGLIEAILIFIAAGIIIYESIDRILSPREVESATAGIMVMLFAAGVNVIVSAYLFKVAREEQSVALEADALHLSTDVLTSLGVVGGLALMELTGWYIMDPLVALAVSGIIIHAAIGLTRKTTSTLVDSSCSIEEEREVFRILRDEAPDCEFHDLRSRRGGKFCFFDVHMNVPADMSVEEAHLITEHLEEMVHEQYPDTEVMIHIEPDGHQ